MTETPLIQDIRILPQFGKPYVDYLPEPERSFTVSLDLGTMTEDMLSGAEQQISKTIRSAVLPRTLLLGPSWHPESQEASYIVGGTAGPVFAALHALHEKGLLSDEHYENVALFILGSANAEEAIARAKTGESIELILGPENDGNPGAPPGTPLWSERDGVKSNNDHGTSTPPGGRRR